MNNPFGDPRKLLGELSSKLESIKDEAGRVEAEGQAGGGMVTVRANGRMEILSVKIEPSITVPTAEDREMLEDLIVAATNQALKNVQLEMTEKFKSLTGVLPPIPGCSGGDGIPRSLAGAPGFVGADESRPAG